MGTDNVTVNSVPVATRSVTYSGDANQNIQAIGLVTLTGSDDAKVATDVSTTNPLPVNDPDTTATGTITVTDSVVAAPGGAGAFVTGSSTAGSLVAVLCPGGDTAWNVQITALTSGAIYFEGSLDSTNGTDGQWINVNGRRTGVVNTELAGNATANGMYRGNTSGIKYFRVRSVGALTGTPAIVIRISAGTGAIFLNASIPAGTNLIGAVNGNVVDDAAFTPATTRVTPGGYLLDDTSTDLVDEGDAGAARMTADRKQLTVIGESGPNLVRGGGSKTDTSDQSIMAASGSASVFNYLTWITVTNTSSTNTHCLIKDGSTTIGVVPMPAFGGAVVASFNPPLRSTANTAINLAAGASVTTAHLYGGGYRGV